MGNIGTSSITALTPVMSSFVFETESTIQGLDLPIGTFLKDMGRTISVYDASNNQTQLAIFRQVQEISNAGTEGTEGGSTDNPFICVWSASESGELSELNGFSTGGRRARVARTG